MRESKFRAWDKLENKYWYDIQFSSEISDDPLDNFGQYLGNIIWPEELINRFFVEQYTGLKDKNGVEIYEGDILSCKDYIRDGSGDYVLINKKVRFKDSTFTIDDDKYKYVSPMRPEYISLSCKVIGNIHENPELLEVK